MRRVSIESPRTGDRVGRPVVRLVLDSSGQEIQPVEIDLAAHPQLTIISAGFDPWARPLDAAGVGR